MPDAVFREQIGTLLAFYAAGQPQKGLAMSDLSNANVSFVLIHLILVLSGLLIWAFWSLDQWREARVKAVPRRDLFDVTRRRG